MRPGSLNRVDVVLLLYKNLFRLNRLLDDGYLEREPQSCFAVHVPLFLPMSQGYKPHIRAYCINARRHLVIRPLAIAFTLATIPIQSAFCATNARTGYGRKNAGRKVVDELKVDQRAPAIIIEICALMRAALSGEYVVTVFVRQPY